jgi:multisubunit Na+/H+ antiporter MnhB subunit
VVPGAGAGLLRVDGVSVADAAAALADPATTVLATPAVLVAAGPGWFHRVAEATMPAVPVTGSRPTADPRRWPAWVWGVLVGLGMITGGVTAAAITLGPLLLWYDTDYLGWNRDRLHTVNGHLVYFVQHDRITLAGTMVAIGVLYAGLAWGGIRRGWTWSRYAYLASGAVGFPTLFYFLSSGFVEPLHVAAAVTLFPMFVLAVRRRPGRPRWAVLPDGPERTRLRAVTGQLVMIAVGAGMLTGGAAISVIGMSSVFVDTDLSFLNTAAHHLDTVNPRLVPFIAHDRAGFGGALMSAAVAVILLSVWGWRRGESWVWWTLTLTAVTGFGPAVLVHAAIGYTSVEHLIPVYLGIGLTAVSLYLSRPYLCDRSPGGETPNGGPLKPAGPPFAE